MLGRLARVLLAAALLAGWQAALLHPLEHVDAHGTLVHLSDDDPERHPENSASCDVLAALTACAAHAVFSHADAAPAGEAKRAPSPALRAAESPPFLAQGPPAAL